MACIRKNIWEEKQHRDVASPAMRSMSNFCFLSKRHNRKSFSIMDVEVKFEYTIHRPDVPTQSVCFLVRKRQSIRLTVFFHLHPSQVLPYHLGLGLYARARVCREARSRCFVSTSENEIARIPTGAVDNVDPDGCFDCEPRWSSDVVVEGAPQPR